MQLHRAIQWHALGVACMLVHASILGELMSCAAQTYTEAAKAKAADAADFTTQKLQDLKVGLVGEAGAVSNIARQCHFPQTCCLSLLGRAGPPSAHMHHYMLAC